MPAQAPQRVVAALQRHSRDEFHCRQLGSVRDRFQIGDCMENANVGAPGSRQSQSEELILNCLNCVCVSGCCQPEFCRVFPDWADLDPVESQQCCRIQVKVVDKAVE